MGVLPNGEAGREAYLEECFRVVSTLPRLKTGGPQTVHRFEIRGLVEWHHWHQYPNVYPFEALTEKDSGIGFNKPDDLGLWSPADFREDQHGARHRRNNNVDSVSFLVFDLDSGDLDRVEILKALAGSRFALHPSFNHSAQTPKFRVVMDLTRRLTAVEFEQVMPVAFDMMAQRGIEADPAALDASRVYYDAGIPDSSAHLWFADLVEGDPVDVDALLAVAPPAAPKREFEVSGASWSQGVLGILLTDAGMVLRDKNDRAEILCPCGDAHTDGQLGGAVLFPPQAGSELGYIHCRHAHCENRPVSSFLSRFPQSEVDAAKLKASEL